MGNSSSGSMISRARVRNDIAAKKVPFTTSAQVPSPATITIDRQAPADATCKR